MSSRLQAACAQEPNNYTAFRTIKVRPIYTIVRSGSFIRLTIDRNTSTNSMFKKPFRGRGRGLGQKYQPYPRRQEEEDIKLPRPTPDHLLSGTTTQERAAAKAKDDLRLAKDWKT